MIEIRGESQFVSGNGLRHNVLRYGDPGAPDLLVLPGITSPAATADFFAVRLADAGFRVAVPDIRGRGKTDRAAAGQYRLTDYAQDVAALIDALDLQRPAILGHSMGARIAAAYAALHGPANHGVLVLVDPPVTGPGRPPYPTSRESFIEQLDEGYRGTNADEVRRFYPKWPLRELELRAEILPSCDRTAILETYDRFHDEDFFGYWARLTQPLSLILGGDSPVVPVEALAELRQLRPETSVATVANAGHMVPWDNLDDFLTTTIHQLRLGSDSGPLTQGTGASRGN